MRIERMKMAIERLNNLPYQRHRTFDYSKIFEKNDCGTVACAAGELALYKPFNKMGLSINKYGDILLNSRSNVYSEETLAEFLGITHEQSREAFINLDDFLKIDTDKVTAKHVADYLQRLLDAELAKTQTGE
jgi:hypothetical protein